MRKILFISPHLDDAVFSCAARILRETAAGAEVTVATVFSHARRRSAASEEYAARRMEDRHALELLGAKPQWLGLLDAPCRNPFYNSFRRIVLETAPGDWANIQVVSASFAGLLDDVNPEAIYLPLGVGTHIDHRLVFAAGAMLPATCSCYFYEDQPYALVRHAAHMRLREIQAAPIERNSSLALSPKHRTAEFLRSFRAAPYVRRYLPPGRERRDCEAQLCHTLAAMPKPNLRVEHEIEVASDFDQKGILNALYAYHSQAPIFLGTRKRFTTACKDHARCMGVESWRAERFWKPVPNETRNSWSQFATHESTHLG